MRRQSGSCATLSSSTAPLRQELLHALSLERLPRVDIPPRIDRDASDAVERAGMASAVAEASHRFERVAPQDEYLLVVAVRDEQVSLLRIVRERHVPHRTRAARLLGHDALLEELAGLVECLDAIIPAVADVDGAVLRHLDAAHRLEVAIAAAPLPLVGARCGIEHNDAVVHETVRDVDFLGR